MKCPFCGSDRGYYQIERVHRALPFNFDGKPIGGTEDVTDYAGRRKQWISIVTRYSRGNCLRNDGIVNHCSEFRNRKENYGKNRTRKKKIKKVVICL